MNIIVVRAIQGGILATGAPIGWLAIQALSATSLHAELQQNTGLYAYMLFGTTFVFTLFGVYVGKKEQLISDLAIRDALTGSYNLRFYITRLKQEIASSRRYKTSLSLIYLDLDHFKAINDRYGHPMGDEVLKQVSQSIDKITRQQDIFARVGGEEFALLLPQCDLANARLNAERIRATIENLEITTEQDFTIKVSISLGVVNLNENESLNKFYKRADDNLYISKQQGRNRYTG